MNLRRINRIFLSNIIWFVASMLLAFFVWFLATTQSDPIGQQQFRIAQVFVDVDEGLVVLDSPATRNVRVNVRARDSVLRLLTADDIIVRASLRGLSAGTHVVPLQVEIAPNRYAIADTQPAQITLIVEQLSTQLKPLVLSVTGQPPADYSYDAPVSEVQQVEVNGAENRVTRVVSVLGQIDLTEARSPLEREITLVAVDAQGQVVDGVTLTPHMVQASVDVYRRDDVKQVSISPRILAGTLSSNYLLSTISYDPQSIFISGNPSDLEAVPDTLFTDSIDLTGRTSDFETIVSIILPEGALALDGRTTVTVTIGIIPLTSTSQFDNVLVEVINLGQGLRAQVAPETVSVLLTAPVDVLTGIDEHNIQAVLDLLNLSSGVYEIEPLIQIDGGQVAAASVTVLPPNIDVIISPIPEETGTPATPSPTPGG